MRRALCRVEEIEDNGSRGFPAAPGGFIGLFAVRRGQTVVVYVNCCPHVGLPLDWQPHQFLTADRSRIICAVHGAEFDIGSGLCVAGPCGGDHLEPVAFEIADGVITVAADAGI